MAVSAATAQTALDSAPVPRMGTTSSRDARQPSLVAPAPLPPRRMSAPDLMHHPPAHAIPPRPFNQTAPGDPSGRETCADDADDDILVPRVFSWGYGGASVFISGAWDGWKERTRMYKSGNEFIALIYVTVGEYQFKYYVDDNWQCAPNLPTRTDETGNTNNVVTIREDELEFDSAVGLHDEKAPRSPITSYTQNSIAAFSSDPPTLPPHLEMRALKPLPDDICPQIARPDGARRARGPFTSHVYIDHLYRSKRERDDDVMLLSQTSRVGGILVNTVFVTTRTRSTIADGNGNGFAHPS